jgi:hypothetical protein
VKMEKIPTDDLVQAALQMMQQAGKPLRKKKGRLYEMPNKETVKVLRSNDRKLHANAASPAEDAKLNIDGLDWVLVAMPKIARTRGEIEGYLIPAREASDAARRAHQEWRATSSSTEGNTTWILHFDNSPESWPEGWRGYAEKWHQYLLGTGVSVSFEKKSEATGLRAEVASAKERISKAAGVPPEAVHISIDLTA